MQFHSFQCLNHDRKTPKLIKRDKNEAKHAKLQYLQKLYGIIPELSSNAQNEFDPSYTNKDHSTRQNLLVEEDSEDEFESLFAWTNNLPMVEMF